jgi:hypothetical protein
LAAGEQVSSKKKRVVPKWEYKKNKKKKILFLTANQVERDRPSIDREFRAIDIAVGRSKNRNQLELIPKFAVRYEDFRQALLHNEPHIVHFSGHGTEEGLLVLDQSGIFPAPLSTEVISELFKLVSRHVECVILNFCYSEREQRLS